MHEQPTAQDATDAGGCQPTGHRNQVFLVGVVSKRGPLKTLLAKGTKYCEVKLRVLAQTFDVAGFDDVAVALASVEEGDGLEVRGSLVLKSWEVGDRGTRQRAVIDAASVERKPRKGDK